jgi:hypothetical protein
MTQKPIWRADLAAEMEAHKAIRMRAEHIAPQIAGLLCDVRHFLETEPRMLAYAEQILKEAEAALPYARRAPVGYQATRRQLGRRGLAPDVWPQEVLAERWHGTLVENLTIVVWVVRRLIRLTALRHGERKSAWSEPFLTTTHEPRVQAMQKTLIGSRAPDRRHVRAWRLARA